ncbi:MAG: hypothetical protein U1C18_01125 [Patescibacteria group bacterium]|nr:hypothetical protein [Patescibacteria group bacterium]
MSDRFSLAAVMSAIARFEEIDPVRVRFFELCTRRVHNWKQQDESRFREIGILVDRDAATTINVSCWTWCEADYADRRGACAILLERAAAGETPTATAPEEPEEREEQEIPVYDFR